MSRSHGDGRGRTGRTHEHFDMTGIELIGDDCGDPRVERSFARAMAMQGKVINLYRVLANAPQMLEAWQDFAWKLREVPGVSRKLRELSIMRIAQLTAADYEWQAHYPMAVAAGASAAQLDALEGWQTAAVFDTEERLVRQLTEELTTTTDLDPATLSGLQEQFGNEEVVELVITAAFYTGVSRILRALKVPLEPTSDPAHDPTGSNA
jgi:4-carboxymuconolactone decarboxylase